MAGIGFQLEKILEDNTYLATLKAHFYSALICSGPWILSILTIFCLSVFKPQNIDTFEMLYFRTTITYVFAFSLIFSGILYLSLSRYLADKLYQKDEEALIPAFNSAVLFMSAIQAAAGIVLFCTDAASLPVAALSVLTYLVINVMWVIMIFLTILRDYRAITLSYLAGTVVAVAGALSLGHFFGITGYFSGYFIGHLVIVTLLSSRIFIEFRSKRAFDWGLFPFLLKNKELVLIGVFYNLAIWIDKIVFWASSRADELTVFLRTFPDYEIAVFFAYLTIIPALSIFLIHVETNFYKKYRLFYSQILDKGTYSAIREAKSAMADSLRASMVKLITCQGIITLLAITFSPELTVLLKLPAVTIPIFRIATLGAFLHSLVLVSIIVSLYFDFQGLALVIAGVFLATNWGFTYLTAGLEIPFLGYGYFFSTLITLVVAFFLLDSRFKRLEFLAFAPQPLGIHREEEVV